MKFDTPRERVSDLKITVVVQHRIQALAQAAVYEALTEFKNTGTWTKSWRGGQIEQVIPAEVRDRIRGVLELAAANQ